MGQSVMGTHTAIWTNYDLSYQPHLKHIEERLCCCHQNRNFYEICPKPAEDYNLDNVMQGWFDMGVSIKGNYGLSLSVIKVRWDSKNEAKHIWHNWVDCNDAEYQYWWFIIHKIPG